MSFNIRYDNPKDGDNIWANRKEMVAETIRFHKIGIAGLQEALHYQVKDLERLLPEYGWFGVGRDDGRAGHPVHTFKEENRALRREIQALERLYDEAENAADDDQHARARGRNRGDVRRGGGIL